jgi:hypothetical protein
MRFMDNRIEVLRAELRRDFDPAKVVPDDVFEEASPCGKYVATIDWWGENAATNCRAVVRRATTGEVVATLLSNDQYAHTMVGRRGMAGTTFCSPRITKGNRSSIWRPG